MVTRQKTRPRKKKKEEWRARSIRQQLLIDSMIALLNKYGSTLDINSLQREFLLTLMGQYLATDASLFAVNDRDGRLEPALCYGVMRHIGSRSITLDDGLHNLFLDNREPHRVDGDRRVIAQAFGELASHVAVIAPMHVNEKLLVVALLGEKVSRAGYTDFELELLQTLCSVSAVAFNNARLFENAKVSIQEIQRLSGLRSEMISRIGHEFRTPLTGIIGGLKCLPRSDETDPIHQVISESVSRLHELIDSLLILNDRRSGRTMVTNRSYDPAAPVRDFVYKYSEVITSKRIDVSVVELPRGEIVAPQIPLEHYGAIIDELMRNAVRFSEADSTVRIELSIVEGPPRDAPYGVMLLDWKDQIENTVGEYASYFGTAEKSDTKSLRATSEGTAGEVERYLLLSVSDTGIGIPEEEIPFVGEPFRQASNSPDQNVRGHALGLAVVQKLLSQYNGYLYCNSRQGQGSTFSVLIPLGQTPPNGIEGRSY
jgi:signal transduction histidine kinase